MGTFYYAIILASVIGLILFFVEIPESSILSERIYKNDIHPVAQTTGTMLFFVILYTIAWFTAGRKSWRRSAKNKKLIRDLLD